MTRPSLPSTGGDYVIRDGVLMPADAATESPAATPAEPDTTPAEPVTARKRRLSLITDEE